MLYQPVDPFPDPTFEIQNVGLMYALFLIMLLMIALNLIFYLKLNIRGKFLPMFIIWAYSIDVGFESMPFPFFPFSPNFQIFFMLVQTSIFTLMAFQLYAFKNGNKHDE